MSEAPDIFADGASTTLDRGDGNPKHGGGARYVDDVAVAEMDYGHAIVLGLRYEPHGDVPLRRVGVPMDRALAKKLFRELRRVFEGTR